MTVYEKSATFLHQPIGGGPRALMALAAVLLAVAVFLPLWNLTMFAPQYSHGLRLDIFSYTLVGGNGGQDIKEINLLNHYIGMHALTVEDFTEFKWMPFAFGVLVLVLLRAIVLGTVKELTDSVVLFLYFGAFSLWSFGYKLYRYGHDLAPGAPVKVAPFSPPMFGYQKIANFEVYSYPKAGTYVLVGVVLALAAAMWLTWRQRNRQVAMLILAIVTPTLINLTIPQFAAAQDPSGHTEAPPSRLERRAPPADASPLQARIDAAAPGDRIEVAAGTYAGDLYIDRPLTIVGIGRPRLIGSGYRSVVMIRADHVTLDGFDIDGRLGGSLSDDSSGVHIAGRFASIVRCRIERSIFGVYLYAADDTSIDETEITGLAGKDPGEQGSGIHAWNSKRFHLTNNVIRYSRDGVYLQSSSDGFVLRNHVSDVRYGLHYMFSDRNVFEDNTFERGAAGAALMNSEDLAFRRNRFIHNRGFGSVGLLLKSCERVLAEDNLIADNARGIFLEGSTANTFRRNLIAESDAALVIYDSSKANRFEGNSFVGNMSPLRLSGRRTDTLFNGNYWSDDTGLDLDGDGFRDDPYRLSNVFDHLRGNLSAADLVSRSLGARALAAAERGFPVLRPIPVLDARPLARPPHLAHVPAAPRAELAGIGAGFAAAALFGSWGLATLALGRRLGRRQADTA